MSAAVSSLPVHRSRYHEFDLLRSISLLLMVTIHVLDTYDSFIAPNVYARLAWLKYTYAFIGPSALMIAMGTNLAFSARRSPAELAKRGLRFLAFDAALNTARYLLPGLVYLIAGYPRYLSEFAFPEFLRSDIYSLVGFFLLLFALFQQLHLSSFGILTISLLMVALNAVIGHYHLYPYTQNYLSDFLCRFFFTDGGGYFPLLTWTIFPAVGFCFGQYFHRLTTSQQTALFRKVILFCGVCTVSLLVFLADFGRSLEIAVLPLTNYKTEPFGTVLMILLTGIVLGGLHLLVVTVPELWIFKPLLAFSRLIVPFYLIHWVILTHLHLVFVFCVRQPFFHSRSSVLLFIIAVILTSLCITLLWQKRKRSAR